MSLGEKILSKICSLKRNMNLRLSFSSAALALVLISPGTAATTFLPTGAVNVDKSLAIRGGAGPLDVDLTAKAATGLFGVQGIFNYLAPEKHHEAYCLKDNADGLAILMSMGAGSIFLAFGVASYFSLFQGMPALKACGAGLIALCVENLRCVL